MPLTKPEKNLKRNLNGIAMSLEDICVDLRRLACQLSDDESLEVTSWIGRLSDDVGRLKAYAGEVKAGRIVRERSE